jgi:hypothetical protein
MFYVVALALINLPTLAMFFLSWNNIKQQLPIKHLTILFSIFNVIIISLWILTGLSLSQVVMDWSLIFKESLMNWYIFSVISSSVFFFFVLPFLYQEFKLLIVNENQRYLLIGVALFTIVLGIWLPFGFNSIAHYEIWSIKHFFTFGPFPNDKLSTEITTRLSILIPHTLFHIVDPNGFIAYNMAHLLLTWFKGLLLFAILKKFNLTDILTLGITTIFLFYPTDTQAMSLRSITILLSLVLFLFAIYTFLVYLESRTAFHLATFFIVMFFSVTYNEYAFIHILFFPLLLFYFEHRLTHKFINLSIIWYIMPLWYAGYYYLISQVTVTYGVNYVESSIYRVLIQIFEIVSHSLENLLITNWRLLLIPVDSMINGILTVIATTILLLLGIYVIKDSKSEGDIPSSNPTLKLIIGFLIIVFAATMFGLFKRQDADWRVYSLGSLGASIFIGSFLYFCINKIFNKYNYHLIFIGVISILVGLAFHQSIHQYEKYWNIAQNKANFLEFSKNYENTSTDAIWVLLTDMSKGELEEKIDFFSNDRIRDHALDLQNISNINIASSYICYIPDSNCKYNTKRLKYLSDYLPDELISYEQIVFFWLESDLSVRLLETLPDEPWQLSYAKDFYQPFKHIALKVD